MRFPILHLEFHIPHFTFLIVEPVVLIQDFRESTG